MNPSWLVAFDFSEEAELVVEKATEELQKLGGTLYLLHVCHTPPPATTLTGLGSEAVFKSAAAFSKALIENAEMHLNTFRKGLIKRFPSLSLNNVVRQGDAVEEILAAAADLKVDRIVLGTHGRKGLGRALMGSVAERVVRLSPVSVLVVKTQAKRD